MKSIFIFLVIFSVISASFVPSVAEAKSFLEKAWKGATDIVKTVVNDVVNIVKDTVEVVVQIVEAGAKFVGNTIAASFNLILGESFKITSWLCDRFFGGPLCGVTGEAAANLLNESDCRIRHLFDANPFESARGQGFCKSGEITNGNLEINPPLPPTDFCGDNICQSLENVLTCSKDCGGNNNDKVLTGVNFITSQQCASATLEGINSQGHNYAIIRNGRIIAELSSSQTIYADNGLDPHQNYEYRIRIPYPNEVGFKTIDSDPTVVYTKCLPRCSFSSKEKSIAKFGKTTLFWQCQYTGLTDGGRGCIVQDINTGKETGVASGAGSLMVSPEVSTAYALSCSNIDGTINLPQFLEVFEPGIKEIRP